MVAKKDMLSAARSAVWLVRMTDHGLVGHWEAYSVAQSAVQRAAHWERLTVDRLAGPWEFCLAAWLAVHSVDLSAGYSAEKTAGQLAVHLVGPLVASLAE